MLVTGDNFIQLFLGWEGVGLASYLLINFWFTRLQANKAAIKAMLVNRVGDFGLALGIMGCFTIFQTVDFSTIFARASAFSEPHHYFIFCNMKFHAITVICILLFIGAVGKSAQIGLHTWLPDAMEGFRIFIQGLSCASRYILTISLYAGIVERMRVPIGKISHFDQSAGNL
jgi:NADH-ubiquinone oxidoreductase chain 5